MHIACLLLIIFGGLLINEYVNTPKKKPTLKRKIKYEKRRAKIHRIK